MRSSARSETLLRRLIAEAGAASAAGEIVESVKWGQASFAPARPRVGSSVRIERRTNGALALMFICHTGLVDRFRELYGNRLQCEGNRAIVIEAGADVPEEEIRHCIAMAFTCHLKRRSRR
jgi:hypothetical protein